MNCLACMIFSKGGVDSIATEGIMLFCSLAAPLGSWMFGNCWAGLLFGILVGILLTCVFGYVTLFLKTKSGLRMRTVGENPDAAEAVGLSIIKYKYMTLIIAGTLIGMGGAFMSMGYVSFFSKNMVAGRGFIGIAAESMGHGMPGGGFCCQRREKGG